MKRRFSGKIRIFAVSKVIALNRQGPIHIDVGAVLSERLGGNARFVPGFVVRWLERLIHQDDMNALLTGAWPRRGAHFCEYVLEHLGVELTVRNEDNMPSDPRIVVASNHPLGGLDGICMIAWLHRLYGVTPRFVVNDLLQAIDPLTDCFVPVNKHGTQSRSGVSALDAAFASDTPVVVYPAGLVSRLHDDGTIADLGWRRMFVTKAAEFRRPVVPVFFDGKNSASFYRYARWRKSSGIKFNLEMILLPREVFRSRGAHFTLTCGRPVPWQELGSRGEAGEKAAELRRIVYSLSTEHTRS